MKFREGFISNSSTTSFIVAFPKKPESPEELQVMLFGNKKKFKEYTTIQIAQVLFNSIKDPKDFEIDEKMLFARNCGAQFHNILDKFFDNDVDRRKFLNQKGVYDYFILLGDPVYNRFCEEHKDSFIATFKNEGSLYNNDDIFKKLDYEISNYD